TDKATADSRRANWKSDWSSAATGSGAMIRRIAMIFHSSAQEAALKKPFAGQSWNKDSYLLSILPTPPPRRGLNKRYRWGWPTFRRSFPSSLTTQVRAGLQKGIRAFLPWKSKADLCDAAMQF